MDFPTLIGLSMLASVLAAGTVELRIPLPEKICALHPELIQGSGNSTTQDSRIIGGCGVETGEAPYQVAIYHGISFICGGALIGSKVVLTTAHCVYGYVLSRFLVQYIWLILLFCNYFKFREQCSSLHCSLWQCKS